MNHKKTNCCKNWGLFSGIVLCGFILLLSVLGSYFYVINHLTDKVYTSIHTQVNNFARDISLLFDSQLHELKVYTSLPQVKSMDWENAQPVLKAQLERGHDFFHVLWLADKQGDYDTTQKKKAGNIRDKNYWAMAMTGKSVISEPEVTMASGRLSIVFAVPVRDDQGNISGVLAGEFPLVGLYEKIKDYRLPYNDSYSFIIEKNGLILAHPSKKLALNENLLVESQLITHEMAESGKNLIMMDSGKVEYTFENVQRNIFFASIPKTNGWKFLLSVPKEIYYEPVRDVISVSLFVSLVFILMLVFLSLYSIGANKRAQAANAAKEEFLATISHEIRTPMNIILGFLQLLENTKKTVEYKKYLKEALQASFGLLKIIDDILSWSTLDLKKFKPKKLEFDVRELTEEMFNLFSSYAKETGVTFRLWVDEKVPNFIIGDSGCLKQVLCSLLSNAVKFTREGEIVLKVTLLKRQESRVTLTFEVTDTGIGMDKATIKNIFEPFTQADGSMKRKYGGMGLGLAISSELVRVSGGEMKVESELGKGTSFYVTTTFEIRDSVQEEKYPILDITALPEQPGVDEKKRNEDTNLETEGSASQAPIQETKDDSLEPVKNNLKLLLVEDNPVNRKVNMNLLDMMGYSCDFAVHGLDAVEKCREKTYDIIFMDCQMPVMDGYEATMKIREEEKGDKKVIIIALTANAMPGDKEKCIDAGMDEYMAKPIDIQQLQEMLNKYAG